MDLVIGCDSNAHHTNWGSKDINARGKSLYDYIIQEDLCIINRGNRPTFINSRSQTVIDITLATTNNISSKIVNWHVSDDISMSDHRWIKYEIDLLLKTSILSRDPRKTDRASYARRLSGALRTVEVKTTTNNDALDKYTSNIQNIIKEAFKRTCPLSSLQLKGSTASWWCPELEDLRKKARKSFNKATSSKTTEDWDLYKSHLREYKKLTRQRQREAWRSYCEEVENLPQAARLQKALSKDPLRSIGALTKEDGTLTANLEESANLLMTTHFPDSLVVDEVNWVEVNRKSSIDDWRIARDIVDEDKIRWAISSFSPFKAPGLDGIYPALLQWGLDALMPHLMGIFRSSLALAYIPKCWREVKVVFIPKPGKEDYSKPKSYRPISLTTFPLKTMERLCERYIRDVVIPRNPLNQHQHAYTPGRSTDSALHLVAGRIERSLDNKESTLGVFIDIEGAFDKTTFPKINQALTAKHTPPTVSQWISNMLSKRVAKVSVEDVTIKGMVMRGCPQGGVISPLLWNLVLDTLINHLNENNFYTIAYADDLVILQTGKFESTLCERMQEAFKIIENWCDDHSLSINPNKTEMVLFTRKKKLPELNPPVLLKTKLSFSKEVKYLGVTFDSKLTWNSHLDNRVKKAYISYEQCRRTVGRNWGLTPRVVRWIYTAIIRPMLTYGAIVWGPKVLQTTSIRKLDHIQRTACLNITGAMKTTPTKAMEVILSLTPLDIYIKEAMLMTMTRINAVGITPEVGMGKMRRDLWYGALRVLPLLQAPTDSTQPRFVFNKSYTVTIKPAEDTLGSDAFRIYTDGSKTNKGAGCGIFVRSLNLYIKWTVGSDATVFQTELTSILIAAQTIVNRNIINKNILILTDSRQALLTLKRPRVTSSLVMECHQALMAASVHNAVTVGWTKGHGTKGNRIADSLARKAAGVRILGPAPSMALTTSAIAKLVKEHSHQEFKRIWDETTGCKMAKELLQYPSHDATNKYLAMTRRNLRYTVGVMTGHCQLRKHLYNMGLSDTPLCRGCEEEDETAEHLLCHCPALSSIRQSVFGERWPSLTTVKVAPPGEIVNYFRTVGWLDN